MAPLRLRLLLAEVSTIQVVLAILLAGLTLFAWKLVRHRTQWRAMNYPGPPHHFLLGHILVFGKVKERFNQPGRANECTAHELTRLYGSVIWLDLYAQ